MSIAQYGISAEVGSLVSEIKKRLLLSNDFDWDRPTPELVEELGDVLWYTALLAKAGGIGSLNDVLRRDLECLAGEIRADVEFQKTLDAEDLQNFFRLAGAYVSVSSPRLSAHSLPHRADAGTRPAACLPHVPPILCNCDDEQGLSPSRKTASNRYSETTPGTGTWNDNVACFRYCYGVRSSFR
jgi:NTP pyrophosphatase (non-canonical NTP hydrolase)